MQTIGFIDQCFFSSENLSFCLVSNLDVLFVQGRLVDLCPHWRRILPGFSCLFALIIADDDSDVVVFS